MQAICQICCNPKRRLRFHTRQLAICQWCVTELSGSAQSAAAVIYEKLNSVMSRHRVEIERELARLQALRQPPPQVPTDAIAYAAHLAEGSVRRDEGFLQSLYRSFVDDTRRREEIAAAAAQRREVLLGAHRAAVEDHALRQREIDSKIADLEARIADIPALAKAEVGLFIDAAKILEPTKSKEVRLLRAVIAGLVDYHRKEFARPEQSEYEELKRLIRARDGYKCVCCQRGFSQGELHVHHVLPLSRYGTNCESNLVTLCHPCHNKQHPGYQVTRTYPIRRRAPTASFVAVDIETTGFSNEDSIIEIAAVRFVGGEIEEVFCTLVRSKRPVSAAITRLTGITQSMIAEAPHPETVIRNFAAFVSNRRLVFHNAPFDMRFIARYLSHYGLPLPSRVLDTLPLARKKLPELSRHTLSALVDHFSLPVSRSHRAKDDSRATGLLYLALRKIPSPRVRKPGKKLSGSKKIAPQNSSVEPRGA